MTATAEKLNPNQIIETEVSIPARDVIRLRLEVKDGEIVLGSLTGIGCIECLTLFREWRPKLKGPLDALPLPTGTGHSAVLLREAILKAQGKWDFPVSAYELCHCRAVPTSKVDAAVVGGCHTIEAVRRATSANTSCGTCKPEVEDVINYRIFNSKRG